MNNVKQLLSDARSEIRSLREQNEKMSIRLNAIDDVMNVFYGKERNNARGLMHPDIAFEIDKFLEEEAKQNQFP